MNEIAKNTAVLEAVLFAAGNPVTEPQLARILDKSCFEVNELLELLQKDLDRGKRGLTLRQVAGGWQIVTRPEYYHVIEKLSEVSEKKLSTPAMETLSIIAFKQPITKQEIEHIRGVRVERSLAKLLELELICEKGRKKAVGHPILYGTTETFLKCFGLNGLDDLPRLPTLEEAREGLDVEQLSLLDELESPMEQETEYEFTGEAENEQYTENPTETITDEYGEDTEDK